MHFLSSLRNVLNIQLINTKLFLLLFIVSFLSAIPYSYGQSTQAENVKISTIEVVGNSRIDADVVLSYTDLKVGDLIDSISVNQNLKELFATGLFVDVKISFDQGLCLVTVVENPLINKIAFEGNRVLKNKEISGVTLGLKSRSIYNRESIQQAVQSITKKYQENGHWGAQVSPKIIKLDDNQVNIAFEIIEGRKTKIKKINFKGNRKYSDADLRRVIHSGVDVFWNLSVKTYNPEFIEYDKQLLNIFYNDNGYVDFKIKSFLKELDPDRTGFYITFDVEEGEQFRVGEVDIVSEVDDVSAQQLGFYLAIYKGNVYSDSMVIATQNLFTEFIGKQGDMPFAIDVKKQIDRENQVVNLKFIIKNSTRIFVERIDILGNTKTEDRIIRREFRLNEGSPMNQFKLIESNQRINNLNYFSKVNLSYKQGSSPDKVIILTEVEEKRTSSFYFSLPFGTGAYDPTEYSKKDEGFLANLNLGIGLNFEETNFMGVGQQFLLKTMYSVKNKYLSFSFTEPRVMDSNVFLGFDVGVSNSYSYVKLDSNEDEDAAKDEEEPETDSDEDDDYLVKHKSNKYVTFRGGIHYSDNVTENLSFNNKVRAQRKVDPDESQSTDFESDDLTYISSLSHSILWNSKDRPRSTNKGSLFKLTTKYAGFMGDLNYLKNTFDQEFYRPIIDDIVFVERFSYGNIRNLKENITTSDDLLEPEERFFLGGQMLRGFANFGIGPRGKDTKSAFGGLNYFNGSFGVRFPLPMPSKNLKLYGRLFHDFGMVWGFEKNINTELYDHGKSIRASFGIGITLDVGFFPISISYAFPYLKEEYDEVRNIQFSMQ